MSYGVQDLSLNNRSLCSASSYVFNSDNMSANTATVNGQLTTNVTLQVYDPLPSSGTNDGTAIYPPIRGYIYTQAFIHCCECGKAISHVGGPGLNSLCIDCYNKKEKL